MGFKSRSGTHSMRSSHSDLSTPRPLEQPQKGEHGLKRMKPLPQLLFPAILLSCGHQHTSNHFPRCRFLIWTGEGGYAGCISALPVVQEVGEAGKGGSGSSGGQEQSHGHCPSRTFPPPPPATYIPPRAPVGDNTKILGGEETQRPDRKP